MRNLLSHPTVSKVRMIVLLIGGFAFLFIQCKNNSPVSPNNSNPLVEIITPANMKSGEYLPIITRLKNESGETLSHITGAYQVAIESGQLAASKVNIKKGVGSITTQVTAQSDFQIRVENLAGERDVNLINNINVETHSGTIDAAQEIWDTSSDHRIDGELIIASGAVLTIREGSRILIDDTVNIIANGLLNVEGTPENPVMFTSNEYDLPWGGIEINNTTANFEYCFFINGGADDSRAFFHSNSQPVILATDSEVIVSNCFFIDNIGKGFGALRSKLSIEYSLISRCDTGGEFRGCTTNISYCHVLDIPNDDGIFVDDDNDGFYFLGVYPNSDEISKVEHSYFVTGKDDAIDHNGAELEISHCWLEGFMHEGVAGSNSRTVKIFNTVIKNCEQGVEAGYGSPSVFVDHCVIVDNKVGLRFGDSYDNGSMGKLTATNTILYNNDDNIYNFDLSTQAPVDSGIVISYSITNDDAYNQYPFCLTGTPDFDTAYFLNPNSIGAGQGIDGTDIGLVK